MYIVRYAYTKKDLQERIKHLEQKKTIYEGYLRQMEQTGETQIALTDPESRIMKTRHGKSVCLNVQTAVDAENHLITNFVVTNQCNDFGLLASTMAETKELLGVESIETIADKGYRSDEDVLKCLLNGDIPNVYPRDGKDCYTFAFEEQKEKITEAEKESCTHAGILPDILKNKPVTLTSQNISVREEMFVRKDTGEIVSLETASIKEDNSTHAKNEYIFVRNLETDTVTCPQGQILHFFTLSHKKESYTVKELNAYLDMTGIRKAEGGIRSAAYKTCFSECKSKGCNTFRPIFWYTDSDKRDYEDLFDVTHSRCYTEYGLKRTDCVGCPFSKHINEELAVIKQYEPNLYKAAVNLFGKSYEYTRKYREFQKMMKLQEKKINMKY